LNIVEYELKEIDVRGWRRIATVGRRLEIDPEGGQCPAWTVQPVDNKKSLALACKNENRILLNGMKVSNTLTRFCVIFSKQKKKFFSLIGETGAHKMCKSLFFPTTTWMISVQSNVSKVTLEFLWKYAQK
jgi:hypothetical protein